MLENNKDSISKIFGEINGDVRHSRVSEQNANNKAVDFSNHEVSLLGDTVRSSSESELTILGRELAKYRADVPSSGNINLPNKVVIEKGHSK